jgi:glutathione S-transferase/heme-degrading monooxygenase HmoA
VTVWESLAICEYIAELFPSAQLWPDDRVTRAWARSASAEMHAGLAELRRHCPMNLARSAKLPLDPATRKDVARFESIVADARARFGATGPYLCGRFSVADAMFAPVITRILSYGIDVNAETRAYVDTMRAHPAVERWYREAAEQVKGRAAQISPITGPEVVNGVTPDQQVPDAACWAVIFESKLGGSRDEYDRLAARMEELARKQPGFLSIRGVRGADGVGITVSYWDSLESIAAWRANAEHREAQSAGRTRLYESYDLRVARVERRRIHPSH